MKIQKLKIVVTFESGKSTRMFEVRKAYLGMSNSYFVGFKNKFHLDYDNFQTFEFSFNNSRKLWHNFKFRNFAFLNLFQISKKIFDNYQKYKQNWWKLAINYHFQISYNEPNYFTVWRTRLNVEHENQETEICGWIWVWEIGKDNWMVENAYLRISHTLHTFWIPQTLLLSDLINRGFKF